MQGFTHTIPKSTNSAQNQRFCLQQQGISREFRILMPSCLDPEAYAETEEADRNSREISREFLRRLAPTGLPGGFLWQHHIKSGTLMWL
jgi:hypothetical protein